MLDLISITKARNDFSELVSQASSGEKSFVILRDSLPQAVLIPWQFYQRQETKWQEEVEDLLGKGKILFKSWLKTQKKPMPKNEKQAYSLINQVANRD